MKERESLALHQYDRPEHGAADPAAAWCKGESHSAMRSVRTRYAGPQCDSLAMRLVHHGPVIQASFMGKLTQWIKMQYIIRWRRNQKMRV